MKFLLRSSMDQRQFKGSSFHHPPRKYTSSKTSRENFTISEVVYPMQDSGDIAPGLSVTAYITFIATGF
jgi:hypothetical protein